MAEIGVRELKTRASEIVRNLRQRHARYTITYRGRPVGLLIPLEKAPEADAARAAGSASSSWDELLRLGKEIARGWRAPETSAELLSQMRR